MTDYITYRDVREITVRLPRDEYEAEHSYGEDIVKAEVVSREEIGRRHEIDYAVGTDLEAELYYLLADGEKIFESRSHDACVEHAGSLGDDISRVFLFGDLDDPDKSWKIMAESRAAAAARTAGTS
ncbi:hypothetical protein [Paenarthrobacter sp. C1]|uniref:hypothetical protein n=1 Tax=Paenarthrobacter sp. C1 TaxID=3400220 RepID=UPI003BF535EC